MIFAPEFHTIWKLVNCLPTSQWLEWSISTKPSPSPNWRTQLLSILSIVSGIVSHAHEINIVLFAIKIFLDIFLAQEQIGKGSVDRISQSPELKLPTEVAQIQDLIPSWKEPEWAQVWQLTSWCNAYFGFSSDPPWNNPYFV